MRVKYLFSTLAWLTLKGKELSSSMVDTSFFVYQKHKIYNFKFEFKF